MPQEKVYLYNGPEDWEELRRDWQFVAENAEGEDIWGFILHGNWPERPTRPQLPQAEPPALATTSSAATSTAGPSATPPSEAITGGLTYAQLFEDYRDRAAEYRRISKAKLANATWLFNSIDPVSKNSHCVTRDLHDWYVNFEKSSQHGESIRHSRAEELYQSALRYDLKNGRNLLAFIQKWTVAMQKGKQADLPHTMEARFWVRDLVNKVRPILEGFAYTFEAAHKEEIEENNLSYLTVAARVKDSWDIVHGGHQLQKRTHAAHAATFGSSDDSDNRSNQEEEPPRKRTKQEQTTPQGGRKRWRGKQRYRK